MLFRAKTMVTFRDILRNPGETFDVTNEEAIALGWNVENETVECAEPTAPAATTEAPAEVVAAPEAEVKTDAPASTEVPPVPGEPTAPAAPTPESTPEPAPPVV